MLTNSIAPQTGSQHQMQYYLDLVKVLVGAIRTTSIEIEATAEERANARRLLKDEGIANGCAVSRLESRRGLRIGKTMAGRSICQVLRTSLHENSDLRCGADRLGDGSSDRGTNSRSHENAAQPC